MDANITRKTIAKRILFDGIKLLFMSQKTIICLKCVNQTLNGDETDRRKENCSIHKDIWSDIWVGMFMDIFQDVLIINDQTKLCNNKNMSLGK